VGLGLGDGVAGRTAGAAAEVEEAHAMVEGAERALDERFKPGMTAMVVGLGTIGAGLLMAFAGLFTSPMLVLLGSLVVIASGLWAIGAPHRQLQEARKREERALKRVGAKSYGGWMMRRLEVSINPATTDPVSAATRSYEKALAEWHHAGGEPAREISPIDALDLEEECRRYADMLADRAPAAGGANPLMRIRHQLVTEVEPAVSAVRAKLLDACKPFGVVDPTRARETIEAAIVRGRTARLQARVEQVEQAVASLGTRLAAELTKLGFDAGLSTASSLDAQVDEFERAVSEARIRQGARTSGRSLDEVEQELRELEVRVELERWGCGPRARRGRSGR
jgi:hypothetical protein